MSSSVMEMQDCDGIATEDDCDDTDDSSTTLATDADCDGVLTGDDCDDTDSALGSTLMTQIVMVYWIPHRTPVAASTSDRCLMYCTRQ